MTTYGMQTTVKGSLDEVRAKITEALKQQGFGILTEINVQKTLKEKIGADFEPCQHPSRGQWPTPVPTSTPTATP